MSLSKGGTPLVVTTAAALLDPLPEPGEVSKNMYEITRGETIPRDSLLVYLRDSGYSRETLVEGVGQYAVRGAVVDVYPYGASEPVRLEFFGEDVESLRHFDPTTQKSTGEIDSMTLMAAEVKGEETAHLIDHLPPRSVILWSDGRGAWQAVKKLFEERASIAAGRRIRDLSIDSGPAEQETDAEELAEILGAGEEHEDLFDTEPPELLAREAARVVLVDPQEIRKAARGFTQLFMNSSPARRRGLRRYRRPAAGALRRQSAAGGRQAARLPRRGAARGAAQRFAARGRAAGAGADRARLPGERL